MAIDLSKYNLTPEQMKQAAYMVEKAKTSGKSTEDVQSAFTSVFGTKEKDTTPAPTPTKTTQDQGGTNTSTLDTSKFTALEGVDKNQMEEMFAKAREKGMSDEDIQNAVNKATTTSEKMLSQRRTEKPEEQVAPLDIDWSTVPEGEEEQASFAESIFKQFQPIKQDIANISTELGDTKGVFNKKFNFAVQKATTLFDASQQQVSQMKDNFAFLEKNNTDMYKDMVDRIDQQEQTIEDTMNRMRENLSKISEGMKTQLDIESAAAGSRSAKQMAALGGKSGAGKATNTQAAQRRQNILQMAKLDTELAKAANDLEGNYLNLKRQVLQDRSLNDTKRSQILQDLDNRFKTITQLQGDAQRKFTEDVSQPVEEELSMIDTARRSEILNEANMKRQNTSPEAREQTIVSLLNTAVSAGVQLPQNILDAVRNADKFGDGMAIALNYVVRNVPRESVDQGGMSKILQLLGMNKSGSDGTENVTEDTSVVTL